MTKLAVIYYSSTGTVDAMARRCAAAGERAGAAVRLRQVHELASSQAINADPAWKAHVEATADEPPATAQDVVWADAVLLGTPTRLGGMASQLKHFLDALGPQSSRGELAGKSYAGFTASMTAQGGQETTLLSLGTTVQHFGGVLVAPGYSDRLALADGNPYGVSHVTGPGNDAPLGEEQLQALDHLTERVLSVARALVPAA